MTLKERIFSVFRSSLAPLFPNQDSSSAGDAVSIGSNNDVLKPDSSSENKGSSAKRPAIDPPGEKAPSPKKARVTPDAPANHAATAIAVAGSHEAEDEAAPGGIADLFDAHLVGPGSLTLQTTSIQDLMSVRQVSKACRDFLRPDNTSFWRDLAEKQFPSAVSGILSDLPNEEHSNIDFCNMAKGLARKNNVKPQPAVHTLRVEDLLLVVDLYRDVKKEGGSVVRETVATFRCSDCSPWLRGEDVQLVKATEEEAIVECPNPLSHAAAAFAENDPWLASYRNKWDESLKQSDRRHRFVDPVSYAAENQDLILKTTLFRRDDWRCISHMQLSVSDLDKCEGFGRPCEHDYSDEDIALACNDYGVVSRGILKNAENLEEPCYLDFCVSIEPILPAAGSPDERNWQEQLRKTSAEDRNWTESDQAEIESIAEFQFRIQSVTSAIHCVGDNGEGLGPMVEANGDFMRVVEGFDWQ